MKSVEIKAPNRVHSKFLFGEVERVFLAGTIDMGNSEDWQKALSNYLIANYEDMVIMNPRRDEWDSSYEQSYDNPQFYKQVDWELAGLYNSDMVIFYFKGDSKSPISLMELGLIAGISDNKDRQLQVRVCCEPNFYRRGNVEILCEWFEIPLFDSLEELKKNL